MTIKTTTEPMEALLVPVLPEGKDWVYEPKWDGFRCLAYRRGEKIILQSKSGKPLHRYFPEVVSMLKKLKAKSFVLDGELLVTRDKSYSFGDLQMRLHPAASRIKKLSASQPATFVLFDILEDEKAEKIMSQPFDERRTCLEDFYKKFCAKEKRLLLSQQVSTVSKTKAWLTKGEWRVDGIVAKNKLDLYTPGKRVMQKFKVIRTADCVVGGFRYGTGSKEVGSLLLGLYDSEGLLNHVGFTSSIAKKDKKALTKKLEKIIATPGFTGKSPGMPSRWSTERSAEWQPLKNDIVVEVAFDQVTDDRFRHGTKIVRFRPDKAPRQCRMDQLK